MLTGRVAIALPMSVVALPMSSFAMAKSPIALLLLPLYLLCDRLPFTIAVELALRGFFNRFLLAPIAETRGQPRTKATCYEDQSVKPF
jgi:hypothetical protein